MGRLSSGPLASSIALLASVAGFRDRLVRRSAHSVNELGEPGEAHSLAILTMWAS